MELSELKNSIPKDAMVVLEKRNIKELRPSQIKSINAGLLENQNLLVCTPTASGKTLIAELAFVKKIIEQKRKAVYIVPLKALASEKYKDFKSNYSHLFKIALSIGDFDSSDAYLANSDLIITTSEKMDSLIRHECPWLSNVGLIVVDEIHLLNDTDRGPTLEILITIIRQITKNLQIIGLSATIGNPEELGEWLNAEVVIDTWRPVELKEGIYLDGEIEFY